MTRKEIILDILKKPSKNEQNKGTKWISYVISDIAHYGQCRDNGLNYISHPKNCVQIYRNLVSNEGWIDEYVLDKYKIPHGIEELALLHDVVEDTELKYSDVRDIFEEMGEAEFFDQYIAEPLMLITHDKREDYDTYIDQVMLHPASAFVKMLDLTDNMNLFGLCKLDQQQLDRAIRYAKYFKKINDEYRFLERLSDCLSYMVDVCDN